MLAGSYGLAFLRPRLPRGQGEGSHACAARCVADCRCRAAARPAHLGRPCTFGPAPLLHVGTTYLHCQLESLEFGAVPQNVDTPNLE